MTGAVRVSSSSGDRPEAADLGAVAVADRLAVGGRVDEARFGRSPEGRRGRPGGRSRGSPDRSSRRRDRSLPGSAPRARCRRAWPMARMWPRGPLEALKIHRHRLDPAGRAGSGDGSAGWPTRLKTGHSRHDAVAGVQAVRDGLGRVRAGGHDAVSPAGAVADGLAGVASSGRGAWASEGMIWVRIARPMPWRCSSGRTYSWVRNQTCSRWSGDPEADDPLAAGGRGPGVAGRTATQESLRVRGEEVVQQSQKRVEIRRRQRPVETGHVARRRPSTRRGRSPPARRGAGGR